MKKSTYTLFGHRRTQPSRPAPPPKRPAEPSKPELDAAWDVVIRAFYLAHEMRYYCATSNLPLAAETNLAAAALENWATRFSARLDAAAEKKQGA